MTPRISGVLETVLYAHDLDAAVGFYAGVLGLPRVSGDGALSVGFRAGPESVLLVFNPAESGGPGRAVPSHGASGPGHAALRIEPGELAAWREALARAGVSIEHEHTWDGGVRSLYLRDPAGNSIELIAGDIWPPGS